MDVNRIYNDLQSLTEQLKTAEQNLYISVNELKEAKLELAEKEADLYNQGKVKGRNEIVRQAELLPFTRELEKYVIKAELKMEEAKAEYHYLQRQFENYQLVVKLLSHTR